MRVLIVDDSPKIRMELRHQLNRLGWDVIGEAENGLVALRKARELKPDLMTLDIIMPEMDGIECYRELRKIPSPPRCLIISVLAAEPRVLTTYSQEIFSDHFLPKPIVEKDLRDRIALVMGQSPLPIPRPPELAEG